MLSVLPFPLPCILLFRDPLYNIMDLSLPLVQQLLILSQFLEFILLLLLAGTHRHILSLSLVQLQAKLFCLFDKLAFFSLEFLASLLQAFVQLQHAVVARAGQFQLKIIVL